MSEVERVVAALTLGPKGRAVLPIAVRRAAGVDVGDLLVARAEGAGRIVLETNAAIEERVWAHAPAAAESNAIQDIRWLRTEDVRLSDEADHRQRTEHETGARPTGKRDQAVENDAGDDDPTEAGAQLLAELGL